MAAADSEKEEGAFTFVDKRRRGEEDSESNIQNPAPDQQAESTNHPEPASHEDPDLKAPPIDFSTFVLSLASSAVYSMGEFQDPVSGKTSLNLAQAKQSIDILSMIEEKTKGNLAAEEEKLLGHLLYDLRMKFISASQG